MTIRTKEGTGPESSPALQESPSVTFPGLLFLPLSQQASSCCPNLGRRP